MFMSESIAPLFPYQYGHARRIACDAYTSLISNTAYTMNSVSYGWWLDGLYQFNDPDIMVFNGYGATANENQSRLISGAVTGIFLDGDDLTTSGGQSAAQMYLTNTAINSVARGGQTFTPVEGNTGTSAANIFVRQENASTWSLAVFNYTSKGTTETVSLSRAGLPTGNYIETNLWDGTTTVVSGSFNVSLNAKQAKLFRLTFDSPANLQWSASGNSGTWDTANSANWINLGNSQQVVFNANDQVLFNDAAGAPITVTVNGTISPGGITVNSSTNNFVFTGPGTISGSGSLSKEGGSTLTLGVADGLTGPVTIAGGVVATASNTLTSVSSITITNGGTLDFDGTAMVGNKLIAISGAGVNSEGALFNSGGAQYDQILDITLVGDTTFGSASGGNSRWDLGDGSTLAGPYKVTVSNPNGGYGEWDTVTIATNVGDMELAQGSWGLKGLGAGLGDPTKTITVDAGTALTVWNSSHGPNSGYYKNIHLLTNSSIAIRTSPGTFFNANMNLEGGAQLSFYNGSGSGQTMNGTYTLNGVVAMQVSDSTITFTNVISGPGGFVWNIYTNEVVFTASNTYSGPTVIGGGLILGLSGNGSISQSSLIFFGGNNPANDSLDVSGRPDQTLTLASGETLGGIGNVNGNLFVSADATLAPAGTNTLLGINSGAYSTGVIAASGAIALNGTTIIKLNGSGTNDEVLAGAGITYGGTLNLVNISGSPLAVGNSFHIFNTASYFGSFVSLLPATPGTGLAWDITQLNIGVLNVVAALTQPVIRSMVVSGGNLIFNGTGGTTNGSYYVLTSTNLAAPLPNWTPVATNAFDGSGNFSVTNAVNSNSTQQYYLIKLP
jgi:Alpha galactosidase C-terminal beta sandwich domain